MMRQKSNIYSGFTIVELLIAIVVIGILAAISVVAFNGVRENAIVSMLHSDLSSAARILEADRAVTGAYPMVGTDANNQQGLQPSGGVSFEYTSEETSYCLTAAYEDTVYHTSSANRGVYTEGYCPGHANPNSLPEVVEIVNANPAGGATTAYDITTDLQPTDLVFMLMSKRYVGTVTITGLDTTWTPFYSSSLYTGSTVLYAYKVTGLSGSGLLSFNVPSTAMNNTRVSIYVLRNLKNPDTVTHQMAGWGLGPNTNVHTPAAMPIDKKQIALFAGVAYNAASVSFLMNPQPNSGWVTDSTQLGNDSHAAAHYIATGPGNVQASMQSTTNNYVADVMFVIGAAQ